MIQAIWDRFVFGENQIRRFIDDVFVLIVVDLSGQKHRSEQQQISHEQWKWGLHLVRRWKPFRNESSSTTRPVNLYVRAMTSRQQHQDVNGE